MKYRASNVGFTLIELGVVIAIIGLILGVVMTQTGLLGAGNAIHVTGVIQDLVKATGEFRNRYKFLPGDFPEAGDIAGVTCVDSGKVSVKGNGNGTVDPNADPMLDETRCVADHLFRANLIRAPAISTKYGPVRIVASPGLVSGHLPSVRNVIELCLIPQDVASDVDSRIDDGNLATGSVLWVPSVASAWCNGSLISVALR